MKNIPIYKLGISDLDTDNLEVNYVALVDEPAIERNWIAFNSKQRFKAIDNERRIISGALMVADLPIYRMDQTRGEHYVVFDKYTIEKIVQKFFRKGYERNVNLMHDPEAKVDGVYMFESFIIDSTRGIKAPDGFDGLSEGTWFGSFKVDNQEVWDEFIKTGIFKGFSVEGIFEYQYEEESPEKAIIKEIERIANS